MGKQAARMLIDKAGHSGPIQGASPNVLVGGMPAARKGDGFICVTHGSGVIIEGEPTVLINGKPAARMGDKTGCLISSAPVELGPKPAQDKSGYLSFFGDSLNEDGTFKTPYGDNLTIRAFTPYYNLQDKTGDGTHDNVKFGVSAVDLRFKTPDWKPFGEEYGGVGASGGMSKYKFESELGLYGSNGMYGGLAEGKASAMSGDFEAHIGKEGVLYHSSKVSGDVAYIEGKAQLEGYWGGNGNKYGFVGELSGDMDVAKAEYEAANDTMFYSSTAKLGIGGGSLAAGGKLGAYWDADEYSLTALAGGKLGFGVKVDGDFSLTLKFKPLVDGYNSIKDYFTGENSSEDSSAGGASVLGGAGSSLGIGGLAGSIVSGCSTVLIGK